MRAMFHVGALVLIVLLVASTVPGCNSPAATPASKQAAATPVLVPPATVPVAAATPVATSKPAVASQAAAPTPTIAPKIKRGGIVKTSYNQDFGIADLHLVTLTRDDHQIHSEALVEMRMNDKTKQLEVSPLLAASWEKPDPKTIIFNLQKGVKFHDGSPFNAEAAKWNLLRMRDHPKSFIKDSVIAVQSVDIVDEYKIKLNLKGPSNAQLAALTSSNHRPVMISKQAGDKGDDFLANNILGTGPFMLQEWRRGDRQIYKRFPDYWQKGLDGQSKPYLDGLEIRFISDAAVAMVELKAGQSHMLSNIQPRDLAYFKGNNDFTLQLWPHRANLKALGLAYRSGPFKDNLKLRQAAQHAIDRESMAKALGQGAGSVPHAMTFPGQVGYSPSLAQYTFDLAKATQLVKDAGFPNGIDTMLTVIARQPDLPQAEVIKSMFDKAGLRTTLDPMEAVAWKDKVVAFKIDMTTYGIGAAVDPYVLLTERAGCDGVRNMPSYCNPKFDACLLDSESAPNEDERGKIFQRCQQILHEEAYYVYLWVQDGYDAYSKKLRGWGPYQNVANYWADLWLE